jgi:hypothetical protein
MNDNFLVWGIAYHSSGFAPRSKRWYRVSRLMYADGAWFELYWHGDVSLRGENLATVRRVAKSRGLTLATGVFFDKPNPKRGSEMDRKL